MNILFCSFLTFNEKNLNITEKKLLSDYVGYLTVNDN